MSKERFTIPPRRFRGETAVVASRLPVELIAMLDGLSQKTGRSRNEVIQLCLEYALDNLDGGDEDGDTGAERDKIDTVRILLERVKTRLLLLPGEGRHGEQTALEGLLDSLHFSAICRTKKKTAELDDRLLYLANRMAAETDNLVDIHSGDVNGIDEIRLEMQALIQERNILMKE